MSKSSYLFGPSGHHLMLIVYFTDLYSFRNKDQARPAAELYRMAKRTFFGSLCSLTSAIVCVILLENCQAILTDVLFLFLQQLVCTDGFEWGTRVDLPLMLQ